MALTNANDLNLAEEMQGNIASVPEDREDVQVASTITLPSTRTPVPVNKTVVKDHIETKRFEGIQEARNPSPETLEKLAFDSKQLQEIEDRIAKQRQLSLEAGKVFDKNHEKYYRESVEGEIRRRNVSRLGMNVAWGYRRGMLVEQAQNFLPWYKNRINPEDDNPNNYTLSDGKTLSKSSSTILLPAPCVKSDANADDGNCPSSEIRIPPVSSSTLSSEPLVTNP